MEGSPSIHATPGGLTARILPAVYLFTVSAIGGVVIGHAAVTTVYHPAALGWMDALAIPLLFAGGIAVTAHLRALEEHTEEEYLLALRRGFSPYVIYFIAIVSLIVGLVTGGVFAMDNADRQIAEEEANEAIAIGKHAVKLAARTKTKPVTSEAKLATSMVPASATNGSASVPPPLPLTLKSILGASTRRTALINNTVLGEGQTASIKAEGVVYQVTCLKINEQNVLLEIEGRTNILSPNP